jgi:hypothetical protein
MFWSPLAPLMSRRTGRGFEDSGHDMPPHHTHLLQVLWSSGQSGSFRKKPCTPHQLTSVPYQSASDPCQPASHSSVGSARQAGRRISPLCFHLLHGGLLERVVVFEGLHGPVGHAARVIHVRVTRRERGGVAPGLVKKNWSNFRVGQIGFGGKGGSTPRCRQRPCVPKHRSQAKLSLCSWHVEWKRSPDSNVRVRGPAQPEG